MFCIKKQNLNSYSFGLDMQAHNMNNKPLLNQQHKSSGNIFFYYFVQTEATEVVNCKNVFCTEIRTKMYFFVNANTDDNIKHKSGYLCKIDKRKYIKSTKK